MECFNFLLCIFIICLKTADAKTFNKQRNIILILVDDLRTLSDNFETKFSNINSIAAKGLNFKNAFAQQSLCAPSRNSFLTGRTPDKLRLYDFYSYWRDDIANFTTIPQYFRENGYKTYSVGKVFHPGKSSNGTDDYPYSWTTTPYHPSSEKYKNKPVCAGDNIEELKSNLICPVDIINQPEKTLPDLQILDEAIRIIDRMNKMNEPYFLAVGFHKPHIPFKCPRKYWDLHPIDEISIPRVPFRPYGMPLPAWHPWTDLKRRDDIQHLNISFPFGYMPDKWSKKVIQAYLACVSYIDDLIGRLLQHVDHDNTFLVFTSDHGWSLGESGLWAKYSNFDVSLRVPLIITGPGLKREIINEPVQLIDLFPTLVDLLNINHDIPRCIKNKVQLLCFEGRSLVGDLKGSGVAYSQYPRPEFYPQENSDKPRLDDIKLMGYTLRTDRFRYTEWIGFDSKRFNRNWSDVEGVELYDHSIDENEALNLYGRFGLTDLTKHFSMLLREYFDLELR